MKFFKTIGSVVAEFIRNNLENVSNQDRGYLEVYDFLNDPPSRVFAYPLGNSVTTWTGDVLGYITYQKKEYRSNFGDKRNYIQVRGINNIRYWGYVYGTYVRLWEYKEQ
jgi:hypothetical protein